MTKLPIKAEALYTVLKNKDKTKRFDGFRLTIGEHVIEPIPINYIRISELPKLESLLREAYELGQADTDASKSR